MKTILCRQGDCLILTQENFKAPVGLKFKPCKVLHKGNNHDHYFSKGEVLEATKESKRYLRVKKEAILSHGRGNSTEHKDLKLKVRDYWTEIQSFQDHVMNLKREVID